MGELLEFAKKRKKIPAEKPAMSLLEFARLRKKIPEPTTPIEPPKTEEEAGFKSSVKKPDFGTTARSRTEIEIEEPTGFLSELVVAARKKEPMRDFPETQIKGTIEPGPSVREIRDFPEMEVKGAYQPPSRPLLPPERKPFFDETEFKPEKKLETKGRMRKVHVPEDAMPFPSKPKITEDYLADYKLKIDSKVKDLDSMNSDIKKIDNEINRIKNDIIQAGDTRTAETEEYEDVGPDGNVYVKTRIKINPGKISAENWPEVKGKIEKVKQLSDERNAIADKAGTINNEIDEMKIGFEEDLRERYKKSLLAVGNRLVESGIAPDLVRALAAGTSKSIYTILSYANILAQTAAPDEKTKAKFNNVIDGLEADYNAALSGNPIKGNNFLTEGILQLVQMAPFLTAGAVTGGQAWYASTAGDMYQGLKNKGVKHDEAAIMSLVAAVPHYYIEKLQFGQAVDKYTASKLQNILSRFITGKHAKPIINALDRAAQYGGKVTKEVIEEALQQSIESFVDEYGDVSVGEGKKVSDFFGEGFKEMVEAAKSSVVPSAILSAIGASRGIKVEAPSAQKLPEITKHGKIVPVTTEDIERMQPEVTGEESRQHEKDVEDERILREDFMALMDKAKKAAERGDFEEAKSLREKAEDVLGIYRRFRKSIEDAAEIRRSAAEAPAEEDVFTGIEGIEPVIETETEAEPEVEISQEPPSVFEETTTEPITVTPETETAVEEKPVTEPAIEEKPESAPIETETDTEAELETETETEPEEQRERVKGKFIDKIENKNIDPLMPIPMSGVIRKEVDKYKKNINNVQEEYDILFIDIDNAKAFNDVMGHDVADGAFKAVGMVVGEHAGDYPVGRWGGEEILAIVPKSKSKEIAGKIRSDVETRVLVDGQPVTVSIGVGSSTIKTDKKTDRLVADLHLYEAKEGGRNRVVGIDKSGKKYILEGKEVDKPYVRQFDTIQGIQVLERRLSDKSEIFSSEERKSIERTLQALKERRDRYAGRKAGEGVSEPGKSPEESRVAAEPVAKEGAGVPVGKQQVRTGEEPGKVKAPKKEKRTVIEGTEDIFPPPKGKLSFNDPRAKNLKEAELFKPTQAFVTYGGKTYEVKFQKPYGWIAPDAKIKRKKIGPTLRDSRAINKGEAEQYGKVFGPEENGLIEVAAKDLPPEFTVMGEKYKKTLTPKNLIHVEGPNYKKTYQRDDTVFIDKKPPPTKEGKIPWANQFMKKESAPEKDTGATMKDVVKELPAMLKKYVGKKSELIEVVIRKKFPVVNKKGDIVRYDDFPDDAWAHIAETKDGTIITLREGISVKEVAGALAHEFIHRGLPRVFASEPELKKRFDRAFEQDRKANSAIYQKAKELYGELDENGDKFKEEWANLYIENMREIQKAAGSEKVTLERILKIIKDFVKRLTAKYKKYSDTDVNEMFDIIISRMPKVKAGEKRSVGGAFTKRLPEGPEWTPYSTLRVTESEGEKGRRSHTTRRERGTIPTAAIAHLQGESGEVRGEHRLRKGEKWREFKDDIRKNGIKEAILILNDPGEVAKVSEGNHRLDAAIEIRMKEVPVDIRYFGKSETEGLAYKFPEEIGMKPEQAFMKRQYNPYGKDEETNKEKAIIPEQMEESDNATTVTGQAIESETRKLIREGEYRDEPIDKVVIKAAENISKDKVDIVDVEESLPKDKKAIYDDPDSRRSESIARWQDKKIKEKFKITKKGLSDTFGKLFVDRQWNLIKKLEETYDKGGKKILMAMELMGGSSSQARIEYDDAEREIYKHLPTIEHEAYFEDFQQKLRTVNIDEIMRARFKAKEESARLLAEKAADVKRQAQIERNIREMELKQDVMDKRLNEKVIKDLKVLNRIEKQSTDIRDAIAQAQEELREIKKSIKKSERELEKTQKRQAEANRRYKKIKEISDTYMATEDKTEKYFNPGGETAEQARKWLEKTRKALGPGQWKNLVAASNAYNKLTKSIPEKLYKEGIITKEYRDYLHTVHRYYHPRLFLKYADPANSQAFTSGGRKISVGESGIEPLAQGSEDALIKDTRYLMQRMLLSANGRVFKNRVNKELLDAVEKEPGILGVKIEKPTGQDKYGNNNYNAEIPRGYTRIYAYKDGVKYSMLMPDEIAQDWTSSDPILNHQAFKYVKLISGTTFLKMGATGINPVFAIRNFCRDFAYTLFVNHDAYTNTLLLDPFMLGYDIVSVVKDVFRNGPKTRQMAADGGMQEYLSSQSLPFKQRFGETASRLSRKAQAVIEALAFLNNKSEVLMRMALRERFIKNGMDSREATWRARRQLDFMRGGSVTKIADTFIPYLGASVQGTRGAARAFKENPKMALYKAAQIALFAAGLSYFSREKDEEAYNAISSREKANNWVIPWGTSYKDPKTGIIKYRYFVIAKDQGNRFPAAIGEAFANMMAGKDLDFGNIIYSIKDMLPIVPTSMVPPLINAFVTYSANYDLYRGRNIWHGREPVAPSSERKLIEAGRYSEGFAAFGKLTKMIQEKYNLPEEKQISPDRLATAVHKIFPQNLYTDFLGLAFDKMLKDQPVKAQREVNKNIHMIIERWPFVREIYRTTYPYDRDMSEYIKDIEKYNINIYDNKGGLRTESDIATEIKQIELRANTIKQENDYDIDRILAAYDLQKTEDLTNMNEDLYNWFFSERFRKRNQVGDDEYNWSWDINRLKKKIDNKVNTSNLNQAIRKYIQEELKKK